MKKKKLLSILNKKLSRDQTFEIIFHIVTEALTHIETTISEPRLISCGLRFSLIRYIWNLHKLFTDLLNGKENAYSLWILSQNWMKIALEYCQILQYIEGRKIVKIKGNNTRMFCEIDSIEDVGYDVHLRWGELWCQGLCRTPNLTKYCRGQLVLILLLRSPVRIDIFCTLWGVLFCNKFHYLLNKLNVFGVAECTL